MPQPPVIATLSELVRINSVNNAYAGGPGEAKLAEWIERFFAQHHIATTRQEVFPGRFNVLARIPGRRRDRCLVLEAHMDTVSSEGMAIAPFEPVIEGGRLHGRGACDTKAGLAAMMHTLVDVHQGKDLPPCDVLLAAVVDEEHSFRGVVRLCESLKADAAVVAEPTQLRCVVASKGVLRWKVRVNGKAAHSSKPHLGVNAIRHMARVVLALEEHYEALAQRTHPLLGPATCVISTIRGGVQINFVPDQCVIELDRRLLPGEDPDALLADCQSVLDSLPGIDAFVEQPPLLSDAALDTPPDARIATTCSDILRDMGLDPEPCGVPFGSDASKFSRAGVPAVIFGPGSIDRAHAADEYVEVDQVITALDFYRRLVLSFDPA